MHSQQSSLICQSLLTGSWLYFLFYIYKSCSYTLRFSSFIKMPPPISLMSVNIKLSDDSLLLACYALYFSTEIILPATNIPPYCYISYFYLFSSISFYLAFSIYSLENRGFNKVSNSRCPKTLYRMKEPPMSSDFYASTVLNYEFWIWFRLIYICLKSVFIV